MTANLHVALLILGAGALVVRAGITNPQGGALGEVGRVLRGQAATTTPAASAGSVSPPDAATSATGAAVVSEARAQLGKPYVFGGNGPATFDCSGLTRWCYAKAGVSLPRIASAQQLTGQAVPGLSSAQPGDLLFYGTPAHHVAIYIGGGQQIAAPHTGTVVQVQHAGGGDFANIRRPR